MDFLRGFFKESYGISQDLPPVPTLPPVHAVYKMGTRIGLPAWINGQDFDGVYSARRDENNIYFSKKHADGERCEAWTFKGAFTRTGFDPDALGHEPKDMYIAVKYGALQEARFSSVEPRKPKEMSNEPPEAVQDDAREETPWIDTFVPKSEIVTVKREPESPRACGGSRKRTADEIRPVNPAFEILCDHFKIDPEAVSYKIQPEPEQTITGITGNEVPVLRIYDKSGEHNLIWKKGVASGQKVALTESSLANIGLNMEDFTSQRSKRSKTEYSASVAAYRDGLSLESLEKPKGRIHLDDDPTTGERHYTLDCPGMQPVSITSEKNRALVVALNGIDRSKASLDPRTGQLFVVAEIHPDGQPSIQRHSHQFHATIGTLASRFRARNVSLCANQPAASCGVTICATV